MPASHSCTPVHWCSTSTTAFPIRRPVPDPGNFGMANNFSSFLPETTISRRSAFTPSQSGRSFPSKGATRGVPGETYFEHLDLWSDGHPCGPHAVDLYTMSVHQHPGMGSRPAGSRPRPWVFEAKAKAMVLRGQGQGHGSLLKSRPRMDVSKVS